MKVGVIFAIYNCKEYVDRCLSPWFKLRDKHDFILTVTSGRFKDYLDLGIPNKNYQTLKELVKWEFDFMSVTGGKNLLDEDSSRNRCLDYLKPHGCDLIWLVDGDEFYTEDQIERILDFIKETPEKEAFSLWLKNYTVRVPLFTKFNRPTIYRNRLYGGIDRFYFDSYFSFADGIHEIKSLEIFPIPPEIAFVEHYSWLSTDAIKDKIKYQNKRYCGPGGDFPEEARCSFKWNPDLDNLEFNESFYSFYGSQIPVLHDSGDPYSFSLEISFNRAENRIDILNHLEEGAHIFIIKEFSGREYGSFEIYLSPGFSYWINPTGSEVLDSNPHCIGIEVEVFKDGLKIHSEKLHLKFN